MTFALAQTLGTKVTHVVRPAGRGKLWLKCRFWGPGQVVVAHVVTNMPAPVSCLEEGGENRTTWGIV